MTFKFWEFEEYILLKRAPPGKAERILVATVLLILALTLVHSKAHAFTTDEAKTYARDTLCAPLKKFERSCTGVKAAASALGKTHATWLARKCGATDIEMQQAAECFQEPPQK